MKIKILSVSLLLNIILLVGCGSTSGTSSTSKDLTKYEIIDSQVYSIRTKDDNIVAPFNTVITIRTFCQQDYQYIFPTFNKEIQRLHMLFDRYNDFVDEDGNDITNLKDINESYGSGERLMVDQDLIDLLSFSIELSKLTEGYFNPTLGELIDTWNYREVDGETYTRFSPYCFEEEDPLEEDVVNAKTKSIPYNELENYIIIDDENNTIEFKKYNDIDKITISLGAIAKGYAVEKGKAIVDLFNVPAMIDGGSSSSYGIGKNPNPDRDYWVIGLAAPYKSAFSVAQIATVKFEDTYTLSVSGDYESSFYFIDENNERIIRHHILNPYTGYPENFYRVLSLKSTSRSDILDGLSTALFSIDSTDEIMKIIKNVEDYYNISIEVLLEKEIDQENKMIDLYLTQNFKNCITQYNTKYFNEKFIIEKK